MSFPHLHVASAYSTHYGVTLPEALVEQAAAQGSDFLAVTDRDGLYGAVKHVRACAAAGIRPGLGAELAVHDDEHRPLGRVVVLAHGNTKGRGYGALCRAVSAAHQLGKKPSVSRARLATLASLRSLTVLIGPASDVGQAIERRDSSDAHARITAWNRAMPPESIALEVVSHLTELGTRGSVTPATKMLSMAEAMLLPAVLTNAVRYGTPEEAATADLADAARLLTPLAQLDQVQVNGQAYLKPGWAMRQVARMMVDVGTHEDGALERLLRDTEQLAAFSEDLVASCAKRVGRSSSRGLANRNLFHCTFPCGQSHPGQSGPRIAWAMSLEGRPDTVRHTERCNGVPDGSLRAGCPTPGRAPEAQSSMSVARWIMSMRRVERKAECQMSSPPRLDPSLERSLSSFTAVIAIAHATEGTGAERALKAS
ncbi:MAG: DNA-directed polymerase [Microbacteriaceae bacterium]|nr:DNA-directed polymerase [Microbacteriaceae bacterium]